MNLLAEIIWASDGPIARRLHGHVHRMYPDETEDPTPPTLEIGPDGMPLCPEPPPGPGTIYYDHRKDCYELSVGGRDLEFPTRQDVLCYLKGSGVDAVEVGYNIFDDRERFKKAIRHLGIKVVEFKGTIL